jgi:hypothetical protein
VLLAWAVSCDSYELREDGAVDIVGAGLDTFYVDGLPARLELTVLVLLHLLEDERGEIEVHMLGPDTTSLGTLRYTVEADPGPNHRHGYLVNQIEALEVGFPAEREGIYSVEIYVPSRRGEVTSEDRRATVFLSVREDLPE